MSQSVTIQGVEMSREAAECVEETSADVGADVALLRSGKNSRERLLAHCLNGADADREQGWRDYVEAVAARAEKLGRIDFPHPQSDPNVVG